MFVLVAEEAQRRNEELMSEVKSLKRQGRVLLKQRDVLVNNLSSLLKTAQGEISRKESEISMY